MTYKRIIIIAAFLGATAVMLGAFGAHALKNQLSESQLISYKTGVTYHFFHAILLLLIGILYKLDSSKFLRIAAWTTIIGIVLFSGSIYILACKDLLAIENTALIGPITPIGGLLFIGSWVLIGLNYIVDKG